MGVLPSGERRHRDDRALNARRGVTPSAGSDASGTRRRSGSARGRACRRPGRCVDPLGPRSIIASRIQPASAAALSSTPSGRWNNSTTRSSTCWGSGPGVRYVPHRQRISPSGSTSGADPGDVITGWLTTTTQMPTGPNHPRRLVEEQVVVRHEVEQADRHRLGRPTFDRTHDRSGSRALHRRDRRRGHAGAVRSTGRRPRHDPAASHPLTLAAAEVQGRDRRVPDVAEQLAEQCVGVDRLARVVAHGVDPPAGDLVPRLAHGPELATRCIHREPHPSGLRCGNTHAQGSKHMILVNTWKTVVTGAIREVRRASRAGRVLVVRTSPTSFVFIVRGSCPHPGRLPISEHLRDHRADRLLARDHRADRSRWPSDDSTTRTRSGWFLLIGLIPIVGGIILLVFLATAGRRRQPNNYGAPDPGIPAA